MRVVSELAFSSSVATDLMRFLVRIRGARTPPPRMDEPVTKIPLRLYQPMSTKEHKTRTYGVLAPSCSKNAESYAETDARRRPHVRT
jgi:hypothetical protein